MPVQVHPGLAVQRSKRYAELMTVTKKLLETVGVSCGDGNDQDITDPAFIRTDIG